MSVELKSFKYNEDIDDKKLRLKLAVDVKNVVFGYKKDLKILNHISVQIPEGMLIR
jgi:ABC-type transport system involved in Fe-S cluster assembly fused permease/ATPase subunit